ncbi:hypothetical protein DRQ50_02515 [bacterium]|nr:MAG: hypothetical protein DRQ50_02515 [bacterium]
MYGEFCQIVRDYPTVPYLGCELACKRRDHLRVVDQEVLCLAPVQRTDSAWAVVLPIINITQAANTKPAVVR